MTADTGDVAAALAELPRTTGEASWRVVHDYVSDVLASARLDSRDTGQTAGAVAASLDDLADTVSHFRRVLIGHPANPDRHPEQAEEFVLDPQRARAWLAAKLEELGADGSSEATFLDLGSEDFHDALEQYVYELVEAGALSEPPGWSIGFYALEDSDGWGYLATVRVSNDAIRGGGPFFQVGDTSEDVSAREPVLHEVGHIVRAANRLLPIAKAALVGISPEATHHADGMCKAHGDYDCGEDECG